MSLWDSLFGGGDDGISGIGPVASGDDYGSLLSSIGGSTGIGPYADPEAYASELAGYTPSPDVASSSATGSGANKGGFSFDSLLNSFTSPAGIASLLGVTSNYLSGAAQLKAAKDKADADKQSQELQYLLELAKLKYAPHGGGGGGGGGGSGLARYQALLQATNNAATLRSNALRGLSSSLGAAYK